jgi:hypothetical protein
MPGTGGGANRPTLAPGKNRGWGQDRREPARGYLRDGEPQPGLDRGMIA